MRIIFSPLILLAPILLTPVLVTPLAAQETSVRQVLQQQQAAWNHHDLEAFMAGY